MKSHEMLKAHLSNLRHRKSIYNSRINRLKEEIILIEVDIEHFNNFNINSLYLKAIGVLNFRVQENEEQYLELSVEYNDLSKAMELIDFEIKVLENQLYDGEKILADFQLELSTFDEKYLNHDLKDYREVMTQLHFKLRYEKELSEAISEGQKTIEKFDDAIQYLKNSIFKEDENNDLVEKSFHDLGSKGLNSYKMKVISISHAFIKYVGEVNEVFILILENKQIPKEGLKRFVEYYRKVLIEDLMNAVDFDSSIGFLNKYKEVIDSLNADLQVEMAAIKKEIIELEERELVIIQKITDN